MDKHSYNEHICNNMRYRREHGLCGHNDVGHGVCGHNDVGYGICGNDNNNYAQNDRRYDCQGNTMPPV
jgi:hypothetical protein